MPITIPPLVVTGGVISAAHINGLRNAIAAAYGEHTSWTAPVAANGFALSGVGAISGASLTVTGAIVASTVTAGGAISGGTISGAGGSLIITGASDTIIQSVTTGSGNSAMVRIVGKQGASNEEWNIVAVGSGLGTQALRFVRGVWTGVPTLELDLSGNMDLDSANDTQFTVRSTGTAQSARIRMFGRQASVDNEFNIVASGSALDSASLLVKLGHWVTGTTVLRLALGRISVPTLPGHANNAAAVAAGMAINELYKTATGVVMQVF